MLLFVNKKVRSICNRIQITYYFFLLNFICVLFLFSFTVSLSGHYFPLHFEICKRILMQLILCFTLCSSVILFIYQITLIPIFTKFNCFILVVFVYPVSQRFFLVVRILRVCIISKHSSRGVLTSVFAKPR